MGASCRAAATVGLAADRSAVRSRLLSNRPQLASTMESCRLERIMARKSPQKIGFQKEDGLKGFVDVYGAKHDDWEEDLCCWVRSREGSKDIVTRFDSLSRLFKIRYS